MSSKSFSVLVPKRAHHLAKQAIDEAIAEYDSLGEVESEDSRLILQVLRDNTILLAAKFSEEGGESWLDWGLLFA